MLILIFYDRREYKKKKPKITKQFYKLFYADEKGHGKEVIMCKLLKSEKYRVKGKPDYIIKNVFLNRYIPIEIKSGEIKNKLKPKEKDLMQIGVYFLLIEDNFGSRPKKGLLVYKDYMFVVKNKRRIRKKVLNTIKSMDKMLVTGKGVADASYKKCEFCICRKTVCKHI